MDVLTGAKTSNQSFTGAVGMKCRTNCLSEDEKIALRILARVVGGSKLRASNDGMVGEI